MPMIKIQYDTKNVEDEKIQQLSEATQKIVSEVTEIEDVFVYANASKITVKIAPIEIWVHMSEFKIKDINALMDQIKTRLSDWKAQTNFPYPINLSIVPEPWKVEINI